MLKLLTAFLLGSLSLGITSCSLSRLKSEAHPSPTPSAQHDADQASKPVSEPTRSANWNEAGNESAPANSQVTDELHTPARGTAERQLMMDALRQAFDTRRSDYYHAHRGSITFVVSQLKAHNGWAWVNASPQSTDSSDQFGEYSGFLLHGGDAGWAVMKLPAMINDPNDPENLDYPTRKDVQRIRQMYPTVPTDIFPGKQ